MFRSSNPLKKNSLNCWIFEKYGRCIWKNCKFFHRFEMDRGRNKIIPEKRKACLHYIYNNRCPLKSCSFMHIDYVPFSVTLRNFVFEDFGYKRKKNFKYLPDPPRIPCRMYNRTSGCIHDFCRHRHVLIPHTHKKVIVLIGEFGSGCSTLGNVILWSQSDFRERHNDLGSSEPHRSTLPKDKGFQVGWDDIYVIIILDSTSIQSNSDAKKILGEIAHFCGRKCGGINSFVYVTRDGNFESQISSILLKQILNILTSVNGLKNRFLIARTHFEMFQNGFCVEKEKMRVLENLKQNFQEFEVISPSKQIVMMDNINALYGGINNKNSLLKRKVIIEQRGESRDRLDGFFEGTMPSKKLNCKLAN